MLNTLIDGVKALFPTVSWGKPYDDRIKGKKHLTARELLSESIVEYTSSARSEPITMVDHTIIHQPELPDLLATLTSVYAAMYSQSFSLAINQDIGDIRVMKVLDKINGKRSTRDAAFQFAGLESYSLMLPDYKRDRFPSLEGRVSLEASSPRNNNNRRTPGVYIREGNATVNNNDTRNITNNNNNSKNITNNNTTTNTYLPKEDAALSRTESKVDTDAIAKFHSNLTTGIMFKVSVNANNRTVEVPITVRLMVNSLDKSNVLSLLEAAVINRTAKERYREWRAGGLNFWTDVILCRDILRADRKNMIKDKSGIFHEILERKSNNRIAGFLSASPSISNISNILITSKDTIREFERNSFKKIDNAQVRAKIFGATQVMILAVVDPDYETVTLYYHDIDVPTTVTFKSLKGASKNGNVDPMEILKAYQLGNGIRL